MSWPCRSSKEAALLGGAAGVESVAVYGGVKYGPQTSALRDGAQLVIGTPGRILDHLLQRNLRLDDLHQLVFDEADRMLSMGFYPDMVQVQTFLPSRRIHGSMFSATFPAHVLRLAQQFLTEPDFLSLSRDRVHVAEAEHILYADPGMKKDRALVRLIEMENPAAAIVFCNTRRIVDYVTIVLQRFGYDADKISSDLNQSERERVMRRVRRRQAETTGSDRCSRPRHRHPRTLPCFPVRAARRSRVLHSPCRANGPRRRIRRRHLPHGVLRRTHADGANRQALQHTLGGAQTAHR